MSKYEGWYQLLEAISDGTFVVDQTGQCLDVNPQLCQLLGYSKAEASALRLDDLMPQDSRDRILRRLANSAVTTFEQRFKRKDGSAVLTKVTSLRLTGNTYLAALWDISKSDKAKKALASERRYRNLIEQMPFSIVSYQVDGKPISANNAAFEMWGLTPDSVEYDYILTQYNLFEDPQHKASGMMPYFEKGFAGEFTQLPIRRYDLREQARDANLETDNPRDPVWIQGYIFPVYDDEGQLQEIEILHQDITVQKHAEDRIRKSEQQLASVLAAIPDVMLVVNAEAYIREVFSNEHLFLSHLAGDMIGETIYSILPAATEQSIKAVIAQVLATSELQRQDFMLNIHDKPRYFSANLVPFEWEDEVCTLWAIRDMTEQRRTDLLRRDRSRVLELIAQNEPIVTTLRAIIEMIKRQYPDAICSVQQQQDGQWHYLLADELPAIFKQRTEGLPSHPHLSKSDSEVNRTRLMVTRDTLTDPHWEPYKDLAEDLKLRACWSLPIVSTDISVNVVISLYFPYASEPGQADTDLLTAASQLAIIAMENHTLLERLEHQAMHDTLTGLPNRLLLEDQLIRALGQAERQQRHVAVIFVDLDYFKKINDTLGHHVGDLLLTQAAWRLQSCTRQSDTVGRIGGDEFVLVIPDLQDPKRVVRVAHDLMTSFASPFELEGHEIFLTITVGISVYPQDGLDHLSLLKHADMAMYQAKLAGRNGFRFFTSTMNDKALAHLELERQLQHALERHELFLHYHAIVDASSEQIVGFEALMRWHYPDRGIISPEKFIPLAEESGLIVPMGTWAIQEACRQINKWQERSLPFTSVAVNISGSQFAHADFVDVVAQALASENVDPHQLILEITESVVMQDIDIVVARLEALRALGVRVMIDDFGVGYSSLASLQLLPIDGIKIDRSFIAEIGDHHSSAKTTALVEAVMKLGQGLELKVVAEGVETEAQLSVLRQMGCDLVQGYLFAQPQPPHALQPEMNKPFET